MIRFVKISDSNALLGSSAPRHSLVVLDGVLRLGVISTSDGQAATRALRHFLSEEPKP